MQPNPHPEKVITLTLVNHFQDSAWHWGGDHTLQCTDDVLRNCAPETCVILLTSVTPLNSIKRSWGEKGNNCHRTTIKKKI